jgi:hypothetical protein
MNAVLAIITAFVLIVGIKRCSQMLAQQRSSAVMQRGMQFLKEVKAGRHPQFQELIHGLFQWGFGLFLIWDFAYAWKNDPRFHAKVLTALDYLNQNRDTINYMIPTVLGSISFAVVGILFTVAGIKFAKVKRVNGWLRMWLVFTVLWCGFLYVCNIVAIPPMAYPPAFVLGLGFAVAWIRRGFAK